MPTKHLLIKGKVQGVFYRATARDVAEQLSVTGWIRNTPEGDVEAVVTGTEKELAEFIQWCHQGPSGALVTDVKIHDSEEQAFAEFIIRRGR